MNRFFFLAAGFGKRMGSWTENVPKPLLKVDGISFLDYSLFLASKWGVSKAWVNTHYHGNLIAKHLKDFHEFPLKISYESEEILGTAGGIRSALTNDDLKEPIFLFNPDTLLFPDSSFSLIKNLPSNSKMHLYLSEMTDADRYTQISLSLDSKIRFGEGNLFYIGLALIDPSCLLPLEPNRYADLSPIFKSLAEEGKITGEIFKGTTLDLGEKEKYENYMYQNVFGDSKKEILHFVTKYIS